MSTLLTRGLVFKNSFSKQSAGKNHVIIHQKYIHLFSLQEYCKGCKQRQETLNLLVKTCFADYLSAP
jgi:hypothetical protein